MARPLRGTLEALSGGRYRAGLPVERGATQRRSSTFPDHDSARTWLDAGIEALEAGRPLPEPKAFLPRASRSLSPVYRYTPTLQQVAYEYHRIYYLDNHRAGATRTDQVRMSIERHIVPFFDGIGVYALEEITPLVVVNFARFLGGWPLTGGLTYRGDHKPHLEKSTATNHLRVLQRVLEYAVTCGYLDRDPSVGVSANERYGGSRRRERGGLLTIAAAGELAQYLSPIHQLALWMERLLGLRKAETFGVRVRHIIDVGDFGIMEIKEQGGRRFEERDEDTGRFVQVTSKEELKRAASRRIVWVPPALMQLIRIIIEAYHTDPDTGEVRTDARLIPGIRVDDEAGADTFATALADAAERAGYDGESIGARLTPQHLRCSIATSLELNEVSAAVNRRRFLGQTAGDDVYSRHYLLDDPRHHKMRAIAEQTETEVRGALDDLIIPTTVDQQWGRTTRTRANSSYVQGVLAVYDWLVAASPDDSQADDPLWSTTRIADELGIAPGTARRWLREGVIESESWQWGSRVCRGARRSIVEAYEQTQQAKLTLDGLAEDLGLSYHEAYRTLQRLGHLPESRPDDRILDITDDHAASLREEVARIRRLHDRAVRVAEAAQILGKAERTLRGWVAAGKLEVYPETDSSGARFITRASLQLHLQGGRAPVEDEPEEVGRSLPTGTVVDLTGLSRRQLKDLMDAGVLATVKVRRVAHVKWESLRDWAIGYRPDLLSEIEGHGRSTQERESGHPRR